MRSQISFVLLLLGLLVVVPRDAAAQEFGVLGGVTFSDLTGDGVEENLDRSTGFLAGVFARVPLGQIVAVQPEVQYVRKGAKGEDVGGEFGVKLDYIDVPIFLSFGLPTSLGFHIMAGPNFSFEVGCKFDADTALGDIDGDCDDDGDQGFEGRKSFISAAAVGAGLDFPLGGMGLMLDGRFVIDLESLSENDGDEFDIRNQVFEIVAGLRFGR